MIIGAKITDKFSEVSGIISSDMIIKTHDYRNEIFDVTLILQYR